MNEESWNLLRDAIQEWQAHDATLEGFREKFPQIYQLIENQKDLFESDKFKEELFVNLLHPNLPAILLIFKKGSLREEKEKMSMSKMMEG